MRRKWIAAVAIAAAALLVLTAGGIAVLAQGPGTVTPPNGYNGWGPGMMGGYYDSNPNGTYGPGCLGAYGTNAAPTGQDITIDQAQQAVERYIGALGYDNLKVDEVMEFSANFYAIVQESDTGMGAMELLVNKQTGAVGPEYGPNMMWNTKYGMMRGFGGWMLGWAYPTTTTVTADQALNIAQQWLNSQLPGTTTEDHADAFYGYYTVHMLKDGKISGMLSVNGSTGQVWYHTWHGDFIQMIEAGS